MSINDLVLKVNDVLTGSVLIIALVGIGLLFTFKLGFIQIRGFKDGWNRTFGGLFSKKGCRKRRNVFFPSTCNSDCCSGWYR